MNNAYLQILNLSDIYRSKTGLSEATVATYAAGQAYAFDRLRHGASITFRRHDRILSWFSKNWPEDLDWPEDIPRPEVQHDAA